MSNNDPEKLLPLIRSEGPSTVLFPSFRRWTIRRLLAVIWIPFAFLYVVKVYKYDAQRIGSTLNTFHKDSNLDEPPRYADLIEAQAALPQHNLSLPLPEGANGRYVMFSSQTNGLGWNNILNEIMMLSYLAYESKRAYVFQDYQWQLEHYPWKNVVPPGAPPRTPLPALIGGPTVGAPWPEHIKAPRSIHVSHWEVVCPPEKRRVIFTHHIKKQFDLHWTPNATFIFDTWNKILLEETALCVEVKAPPAEVEDFGQVFDLWLWGGPRILDIWERYRDSVVSQAWTTSPLIQRAVDRNTHLFHNPASELTAAGEREDPFNRMVAVHVRRGDYEPACIHFSNWNSTFYGWNQLPWLPDRFEHPAGGTPGNNTEENRKIFLEHCWPDMDQIIRKAEAARDDWEKEVYGDNRGRDHYINTLYVLTNAKSPWINEFKKKVAQAGGWKLVTSKDIVFVNAQEKDVGMAIDMDFARQAAIFIGNGWSSYSSNVLHRRLVDKKIAISNRFF